MKMSSEEQVNIQCFSRCLIKSDELLTHVNKALLTFASTLDTCLLGPESCSSSTHHLTLSI